MGSYHCWPLQILTYSITKLTYVEVLLQLLLIRRPHHLHVLLELSGGPWCLVALGRGERVVEPEVVEASHERRPEHVRQLLAVDGPVRLQRGTYITFCTVAAAWFTGDASLGKSPNALWWLNTYRKLFWWMSECKSAICITGALICASLIRSIVRSRTSRGSVGADLSQEV
ncbi:hypothetical protein E2C01_025830 [Portunus trituberculatus]|uniref:Uncharacterized protein n=1 Tax=Portunus trituberculatus TaxID=210409 RepID=A0A5B7EGS4_PORTR|nr:hypothetical protein [Portunus trituberculatus]